MPSPGAGEVVVRVMATGIGPGEAAIREGKLDSVLPATFPSGQGSDLAGVVHAVGAGVQKVAPGDEVLGWSDHRSAQADYVRTEADHVTPRPPMLDWVRAGAMFVAGVTASTAVGSVAPRTGETVVVSSAAGGVGSLAVQVARMAGARVIGIAGPARADWLRAVGVEPVAYGDGLEQRLADTAGHIDAFVDTHGDGYVDLAVRLGVAPERIDTTIDYEAAQRHHARTDASPEGSHVSVLARMAGLVAWGEVVMPLAGLYPLTQVKAAYRQLAGGHTHGKIALVTGLAGPLHHPAPNREPKES